jgi:hypothetical protein
LGEDLFAVGIVISIGLLANALGIGLIICVLISAALLKGSIIPTTMIFALTLGIAIGTGHRDATGLAIAIALTDTSPGFPNVELRIVEFFFTPRAAFHSRPGKSKMS